MPGWVCEQKVECMDGVRWSGVDRWSGEEWMDGYSLDYYNTKARAVLKKPCWQDIHL